MTPNRLSLVFALVASVVLRAGASQATDPFVLYTVRGSTAAPAFAPFGPVTLTDDLSGSPYSIVKPRQLAVSGDTGDGVSQPGGAAVEYAVAPSGSTAFRTRSGIRVATECGDISVTLKKPASLLVPAIIQGATVPSGSDSDRFLCYRVGTEKRLADGTPAPRLQKGTQVDVEDRFQTRRYDLLGVTKVCRPVDESADVASPPSILRGSAEGSTKPIENAAIRDPGQALVCYRAKLATRYVRQAGCGPANPEDRGTPIVPSQAPHARRTVATTDEFGPLGLETIRTNEVCLPLATADVDRDGVTDTDDPCPDTVSGAPAVFPGCSALDVVENADRLVEPLRGMIATLQQQIEGDVELEGITEIMGALPPMLADAARVTRGADPCLGQTQLAGVEQAVDAATAIAVAVRDQTRMNALVAHPDGDEDFTEDDARVADLDVIVAWTAGLRASTSTIRDAFAATCRTGTPSVHTRGVVSRVLESRRRIELTDGRVFGLAQPIDLEQPIWQGLTVDIDGLVFGPTGVATDASPVSGVQQIPNLPYDDCLRLRIAPIQRFAPFGSGPYKLLDPKGFESNSVLYLEQGMRLAAASVCNGPVSNGGTFVRHSLRIVQTSDDGPFGTIANQLGPGDEPVALLPVTGWGQLTVLHDAQTCQFVNLNLQIACGSPIAISKDVFDIKVFSDGAYCSVTYDTHELDVNDQVPWDFRVTTLKDIFLVTPQDPGTSPVFEAEGYAFGAWTSFPTVVPIIGQQPFAVHNTDFTTVGYQQIPGVVDWPQFAQQWSGIDHAAALRWPHVRATRNGKEYQYSCRLPNITRDVVEFCNGNTDAYYRLPWAPEDDDWSIGQGNLANCPDTPLNKQGYCYKDGQANCTHAGGYAYDFIAPCLKPFRAARGGRVWSVTTGNSQNAKDTSCPVDGGDACGTTSSCLAGAGANVLYIKHQDGTLGRYVHPNKNKIVPVVGDYVKRGQLVGWVGMTGNTTGPHLHFDTRSKVGNKNVSHLALFQALDPDNGNKLLHCYEPKSDPGNTCYSYTPKDLRSNNKKQ